MKKIETGLNKVLILMSTYNGEEFLQEQLDSLINQKNVEVHILIRDDGSSDSTLKILRRFSSKVSNVTIIESENIGCKQSFMKLLEIAGTLGMQFQYYAFSDQDDLWLENKLDRALSKLLCLGIEKPALYFGHVQLVNEYLEKIPSKAKDLKCDLGEALVTHAATGCTMVFNKKLFDFIRSYNPTYVTMHDGWVYRVCVSIGGNIFYDPKPYIFYRQHSNNVIGGKPGFQVKWKRRINLFLLKEGNPRQKTAIQLLKGYENYIPQKNKIILTAAADYRKSIYSKIKLLFHPEIKSKSFERNIMFKLAVLFGKF